jgi:hypothetical protein
MTNILSFQNSLSETVSLYDSFSNSDSDDSYYGTLTLLGTVNGESSASFAALHGPYSVTIAFGTDGHPIGRYGGLGDQSFSITAADEAAIQIAGKFIDEQIANPESPLVVQFHDALKRDDIAGINALFQQSDAYRGCNFSSYMLALTDRAKNPPPPAAPPPKPEDQTYSLATLCQLLGGTWPSALPDIAVKNFKCSIQGGTISLAGTIDLKHLTFASAAILSNVLTLVPVSEVEVWFDFAYQIGINVLGTQLKFVANDFHIPIGDGKTMTLASPTVSIQLNPLFMFWLFKASAIVPFTLFQKGFLAEVSLVVDNVEAEVGCDLKTGNDPLPAPPPIKGVRFDELGLGIGLIFAPPSYAFGISGKFQIGDAGQNVLIDKDMFVLVCSVEDELITPLYIAFYIAAIDLSTLLTIFTNQPMSTDVPVEFKALGFQWAVNPMEPVILPDGSLTQMAFGCRGYMYIFGFEFYGSLRLGFAGIAGTMTMSPLRFGHILRIEGEGQGVSVKVDANGNPLDNTLLPKTVADKQMIAQAPFKQLVAAGGPELSVSTFTQPWFLLTASVSLFECLNESVTASVDRSGIHFELDFGTIIKGKMICVLADFHNFTGTVNVDARGLEGINFITIEGFSLGSVTALQDMTAVVEITTSSSGVTLTLQARWVLEGESLQAGPYVIVGPYAPLFQTLSLEDLLRQLFILIGAYALSIFAPIINQPVKWACLVGAGTIVGVQSVAEALKTAYNKQINNAAEIMYQAHFEPNNAAADLNNAFRPGARGLASAMTEGFKLGDAGVASALYFCNYEPKDAAAAISDVFRASPSAVNSILQQGGYSPEQVRDGFSKLGGKFADSVHDTWDKSTNVIEKGLGHIL